MFSKISHRKTNTVYQLYVESKKLVNITITNSQNKLVATNRRREDRSKMGLG